MHAINYKFIQSDGMGLIREEASGAGQEIRLQVLLALWASANSGSMRSWLCRTTLKERVRVNNNEAVSGALEFLVERGAIYEVPIVFREGNEPKHKQIRVWQLTGMIYLNGQWMEYLHPAKGSDYFEWLTQKTIDMGINTPFINRSADTGNNLSSDTNGSCDTTGDTDNQSSDTTGTRRVTRHEGKRKDSKEKKYLVASATDEPDGAFADFESYAQATQIDRTALTLNISASRHQGPSKLVEYLCSQNLEQIKPSHIKRLAAKTVFQVDGEVRSDSADNLYMTDSRFKEYVDEMIAACKRLNNGVLPWKILIGMICNFDRISPGQHGWSEWQKAIPLAPDGATQNSEPYIIGVLIEDDPNFVPEMLPDL
jgi:hypothetical protein